MWLELSCLKHLAMLRYLSGLRQTVTITVVFEKLTIFAVFTTTLQPWEIGTCYYPHFTERELSHTEAKSLAQGSLWLSREEVSKCCPEKKCPKEGASSLINIAQSKQVSHSPNIDASCLEGGLWFVAITML